ncbi:hypothetical protein DK427_23070 [Methylobacterium radiodurans]|uniref:Uncharacterized protein n=2 Tax=Methylobacterium radiodurans TaxID=2202828 RepID=A0A2U8VYU9_9HYPH|nr:hypothetical protein DK427_23070 [Methylobacterium radiodurans]
MPELSHADREAVDRLTFRLLKEICCSVTDAMGKTNPEAARTLLLGVETLITAAIGRMAAQQTEGANSTAIAVAVGGRIAEVLDQARAGLDEGRDRTGYAVPLRVA